MRLEHDNTDQVQLSGNVLIEARDARTGRVVKRIRKKNLVVTAGRNLIRDALAGTLATATSAQASHFAVGTGTAAVQASDTALGTEVARQSVTQQTSSSGKLVIGYFLGTGVANGNDLTEAGMFNDASAGTMIARIKHDAITKDSTISINYTWTINIGAS